MSALEKSKNYKRQLKRLLRARSDPYMKSANQQHTVKKKIMEGVVMPLVESTFYEKKFGVNSYIAVK